MSTGIPTWAVRYQGILTPILIYSCFLSWWPCMIKFHHFKQNSHFVWNFTGSWSFRVWKPLTWYSDVLHCILVFTWVSQWVSRETLVQGWIWGAALGWGMPVVKEALTKGPAAGAWGPDCFLPLPRGVLMKWMLPLPTAHYLSSSVQFCGKEGLRGVWRF